MSEAKIAMETSKASRRPGRTKRGTARVLPKYIWSPSTPSKNLQDPNNLDFNSEGFFRQFAYLDYQDMTNSTLKRMTSPSAVVQERNQESVAGVVDKLIIAPDSQWKHAWDVFICLIAIFESVLTPLEVSFGFRATAPLVAARGTGDVCFMVDLVMGFFTAFTDDMGDGRRKLSETSKRYLFSWFVIDFLASFPFHLVISDGSTLLGGLKLLRALRLAKAKKVGRLMAGVSHRLSIMYNVLQGFSAILLLVHLLAALMVQVVNSSPFSTWEERQIAPDLENTIMGKYAVYMYAVIEILLGTSMPTTVQERWFAAFGQALGLVVQAAVLGEVTLLIQKFRAKQTKWKFKMDTVNESMKYMDLPRDLRIRVRNYFAYSWAVYGGDDAGNTWLGELSDSIHSEVKMKLNRTMIESVPLFAKAQDNFVRAVVMCLKPQLHLPGDYVIRYGTIGQEMYFTVRGILHALDKEQKVVLGVLESGSFFGEVALTKRNGEARRTAIVRAMSYAQLNVLTRDDFEDLLNEFPDDAREILRSGEQRERDTKKINEFIKNKVIHKLRNPILAPLRKPMTPSRSVRQFVGEVTSRLSPKPHHSSHKNHFRSDRSDPTVGSVANGSGSLRDG